MEMKVERITPQMALEYLKANIGNYRKLSKARVALYAKDMTDGRWVLNGETITFAENGTLLNGQHRLAAIVQSGKTVDIAVIRGVADDIRLYDVGGNRTAGQLVKAEGVDVNSSTLAAGNIIASNFRPVPKSVVTSYVAQNAAELNRAYRAACTGICNRKASCIASAYLMLQTGTMPFYEVELFFKLFNGAATGTDGYEPSSAWTAGRMFKERFGKNTGGQAAQREQLDILVQALLDFHKGKERRQNYKVSQPFSYEPYMDKVRKAAGL